MAKEVQVWLKENEDAGIVVYPADIEMKYQLGNCNYIKFPGVEAGKVSELIEKLNNSLSEEEVTIGINEVEGFLEKNGIKASYKHCQDIEYVVEHPVLAFDNYEHLFFDLQDCEESEVWQYWNGSNWESIWAEDCSVSYYTISEGKVTLDEWNGRNLVTGGVGQHEYVYKVCQEDGENIIEDKYFVVYSSQWQGVKDTAEVMTEEELREHLKEIERDDDYFDLCKKIEA